MMKSLLLTLAKKNLFFSKLKSTYQLARDNYYKSLKVDDNLIVFEAFNSTKYCDSPREIYEYLSENQKYNKYNFVWSFQNPEEYRFLENNRTKVVKHESRAYYRAFSCSKYWVVNGWLPLRIQKKSNQVGLQCWHGTPLKMLRHDIVGGVETNHKKNLFKSDQDIVRYDYLISTSSYNTRVLRSAFELERLGKAETIIETGYPRNDPLVRAVDAQKQQYRAKFNIPNNKKAILYAPTWRDDQHVDGKGYEYKSPVNFDFLKEKLSDEYVLLFRAHNFIVNKLDLSSSEGFIYDVSDVDEINELYIASDVLMTDYSSVIFDYANLKRPMIFYMYDLEHYKNGLRDFYIDIDQLPGSIVKSETEVVNALSDLSTYSVGDDKKYVEFMRRYNYLDDGMATKRVVDTVIRDR